MKMRRVLGVFIDLGFVKNKIKIRHTFSVRFSSGASLFSFSWLKAFRFFGGMEQKKNWGIWDLKKTIGNQFWAMGSGLKKLWPSKAGELGLMGEVKLEDLGEVNLTKVDVNVGDSWRGVVRPSTKSASPESAVRPNAEPWCQQYLSKKPEYEGTSSK